MKPREVWMIPYIEQLEAAVEQYAPEGTLAAIKAKLAGEQWEKS